MLCYQRDALSLAAAHTIKSLLAAPADDWTALAASALNATCTGASVSARLVVRVISPPNSCEAESVGARDREVLWLVRKKAKL